MLVLFETPAGYAVFKLLNEKKLQQSENLFDDFSTPEGAGRVVKLKQFQKFKDTTEALAATTAAIEGKMSKTLRKMLKKLIVNEAHETLAVADAKLGNAIKDKMNLNCVYNSSVQELMRCIRAQTTSLISGLPEADLSAMALGLAHSLSRYKLKFSPDKVDTMIVQAISLLDDIDKELNNYVMRAREWYGWHFPELGKIVTDNMAFAKLIKAMGIRTNAVNCDMSSMLTEEVEKEVKEAAEISMGTEVSDSDILNITYLCEQVIDLTEYRAQLYDYIKNRMMAIAPNLTVLVGELVGARLISHAGSLLSLAKHPASTVQILGAEKALFRALKTKKDTPKYGLIYHATMVGQTSQKNKGKISRMLAAKASLSIRVDALGEDSSIELGINHKAKLEARLRSLEEGHSRKVSGSGKARPKFEKYTNRSEVRTYDAGGDSTLPKANKRKFEWANDDTPQKKKMKEEETEKPAESPKKKKKQKAAVEVKEEPADDSTVGEVTSEKKKKKKKKNKCQDD